MLLRGDRRGERGQGGGWSGGVGILYKKGVEVVRHQDGCRGSRVAMAECQLPGMPRTMLVSAYFHTGEGPKGRNMELLLDMVAALRVLVSSCCSTLP